MSIPNQMFKYEYYSSWNITLPDVHRSCGNTIRIRTFDLEQTDFIGHTQQRQLKIKFQASIHDFFLFIALLDCFCCNGLRNLRRIAIQLETY